MLTDLRLGMLIDLPIVLWKIILGLCISWPLEGLVECLHEHSIHVLLAHFTSASISTLLLLERGVVEDFICQTFNRWLVYLTLDELGVFGNWLYILFQSPMLGSHERLLLITGFMKLCKSELLGLALVFTVGMVSFIR